MKKLINSKYMKWFRKMYLKNIYNKIYFYRASYCCIAASCNIYSTIICWKYLKEVQENMDSNYLKDRFKNKQNLSCGDSWFYSRKDRLDFLKECLSKLN